jgi:hypothetical protein
MSSFDPYHKWLGIPKAEQPPHHYRLLGIAAFETDAEVIEAAADRQMAYIRQCAAGPYTKESQQILNELSAARVCLLNAAKKRAYDRELQSRMAQPLAPAPAGQRSAAAEGTDSALFLLQQSVAEGAAAPAGRVPQKKKSARRNAYWLWGGLGGAALLVLGVILYAVSRPESEPARPTGKTTTPESAGKTARKSKKEQIIAEHKAPTAEAAAKNADALEAGTMPVAQAPGAVASGQPVTGDLAAPAREATRPALPVTTSPRAVIERILEISKSPLYVRNASSPSWIPIKTLADVPDGELSLNHVILDRGTPADVQAICQFPVEILALVGPQMTDKHLAVLVNAKSVRGLNLNTTSCTDAGCENLSRCPGVTHVFIGKCKFTVIGMQHLREMPDLTNLSLADSTATNEHAAALGGHPKLSQVQLSKGQFTGAGFGNFPELRTVLIHECPLLPAGLHAIGEGAPKVRRLVVTECLLDGDAVATLDRFPVLEELVLTRTGLTDADLERLPELPHLESLSLDSTAITGTAFARLRGRLPVLSSCNLNTTPLTDEGLRQLATAAPRIERIYAQASAITDKGINHIQKLGSLQFLNLMDTAISDNGLRQLKRLRGLETLYVSKGRVSPVALDELRKALPNCNIQAN